MCSLFTKARGWRAAILGLVCGINLLRFLKGHFLDWIICVLTEVPVPTPLGSPSQEVALSLFLCVSYAPQTPLPWRMLLGLCGPPHVENFHGWKLALFPLCLVLFLGFYTSLEESRTTAGQITHPCIENKISRAGDKVSGANVENLLCYTYYQG